MPVTSTSKSSSVWRNILARLGFFEMPGDSERRQHVRHACSIPVTVRFVEGAEERVVTATAHDLSLGGMLIHSPDVPDSVIRLRVNFEAPEEVVRLEHISPTIQAAAAVRFRDPQKKMLSLAFAEPLRAAAPTHFRPGPLLFLITLLPLLLMLPFAWFYPALTKYLAVWAAAYLVTILLTPLVRALARKVGAVDVPDERRTHQTPTPRGGGLALVLGFYAALFVAFHVPWEWSAGALNDTWHFHFMIASGVLVVVGLIDDIRGLKPLLKLFGQMVAASLMFASGHGMGRLLGFELPMAMDFIVTLIWFIALTNAFNLIDGLDGLATGLALIAGVGLMGAFFIRRAPSDALIMVGLAGACLAFLRYNFHPASIFLGDTGSMFLGFTLASISVATGSKGTFLASLGVPLLAVGIPVFDTILAIWRRSVRALSANEESGVSRSKGLMQPDAEHLHHRLKRRGLSQYQVAVILYVVNGLLVLTGLVSLVFRDQALGVFLLAFVVGAYILTRHLAEVELWDTGRAIIRGLSRPKQRVAAFLFYPISDVVVLVASLGIAQVLLQSVHPTGKTWELWISSIPIWVAPTFLTFCFARMYSRVWSLARAADYLHLTLSLLLSAVISLGISALVRPADWRHSLVLLVLYVGVANVLVLGIRIFYRGLLEGLLTWSERQFYRRGGVVKRILLYGSGARCLLYLRDRAASGHGAPSPRMVVGIVDDDTNLRFRRVGGCAVVGTGEEIPELVKKYRVDEIVITAQLRDEAFAQLADFCAANNLLLSEWHFEERVVTAEAGAPATPRAAT